MNELPFRITQRPVDTRFTGLDGLSFIMYFAVILYHVTIYFSIYAYSYFPPRDPSVAGYIDFFMMMFGLLGVPFFFMRCGFFVFIRDKPQFLSSNIMKMLSVTTFWFALYIGVILVAAGNLLSLSKVAAFIFFNVPADLVGANSASGLPLYVMWDSWFIYALVPIYFLVPLLGRPQAPTNPRAALICLGFLYGLVFVLPILLQLWRLPPQGHTIFEMALVYCGAGYLLHGARHRIAALKLSWLVSAFAVLFIANALAALALYRVESPYYLQFARGYLNPMTPILCALLFAISLSPRLQIQGRLHRAAQYVSEHGLDIYLAHTLFLLAFLNTKLLPDTPWLPVMQIAYAVLIMGCSVAAAAARAWLFAGIARAKPAGALRSAPMPVPAPAERP